MDCNNIIRNSYKNKQVHPTQISSDNSHGFYLRAAIMTVIQGCIATTIRGQLLYELWILTGKKYSIRMCVLPNNPQTGP